MNMLALILLLAAQGFPGQLFRVTGKVFLGQDEPVSVVITLSGLSVNGSASTQSFSNGVFRFDNVPLGAYRIEVTDPHYNMYAQTVLLREPADTGKEIIIHLTPFGETGGPVELDPELYSISAETLANTPSKAMEDFNKGVSAIRNRSRRNPPESHFKRAIAAAPKFYEAYLLLGLEQQRQRNNTDAALSLEKAAALKPSETRPLSKLGELYWNTEKFEQAVDSLSKLERLGKMTPLDQYHMGSALYRLNRFDESEKYLLAAINNGNDADPAPFLQLHNVFVKKNQPVRALAVLDDYIKLFPTDSNHQAMVERAKDIRSRLRQVPESK